MRVKTSHFIFSGHDARHSDLPPLAARDDLDGALDQAMAADVMKKFLWQLDDDRRQAFVLSEFGELAGREIAETLDVNMNTIYARIRSARTELDRLAKRMHAHDAGAVRRGTCFGSGRGFWADRGSCGSRASPGR